MTRATEEAIDGLAPLTLAELDARAELRQRIDRKYVVSSANLARLLDRIAGTYAVLEIDGARRFEYRTVYFDSSSLLTYRAHVQRRRRRFKLRSRHYVETGLHHFEVKLKGLRGETLKERLPSGPERHGAVDEPVRSFFRGCLHDHYGTELDGELQPTLRMRYRRTTLASLDAAERLTIDSELAFLGEDGAVCEMAPGFAIVESKSARGHGVADLALRALRVRPTDCSKYCLGITLTRPREVRGNEFLWLARRHFTAPSQIADAPPGTPPPLRA